MKALVCEMCNSNDLVKQDGYFVCQCCGTKYSVEEAKKMMVEGVVDVSGSTVKVDNTAELENLYQLAHRSKENNNSENAQKYYEQIIVKDPTSWEANFYTVYYQSMNCKIAEIELAATRLANCVDTVLILIKDNISDDIKRRNAVDEVGAKLINISRMLFNAAKNHYDGIDLQIRQQYLQELMNRCGAASRILDLYGDYIIKFFGDDYGEDYAVHCWKVVIELYSILIIYATNKEWYKSIIEKYAEKIKKYDSSYQAPQINTGGCYVATAVYGSYDCPQVWTLRRFRDYTLAETWYGRAFIYTYYAISPTIVKCFGKTKWFKKMWRGKLDKMVNKLNVNGVENTPYEDKKW